MFAFSSSFSSKPRDMQPMKKDSMHYPCDCDESGSCNDLPPCNSYEGSCGNSRLRWYCRNPHEPEYSVISFNSSANSRQEVTHISIFSTRSHPNFNSRQRHSYIGERVDNPWLPSDRKFQKKSQRVSQAITQRQQRL